MLETREDIKKYIDECIFYWRDKRNTANDGVSIWTAICYVDAFQSIRNSIFDEMLPFEGQSNPRVTYRAKGDLIIDVLPVEE